MAGLWGGSWGEWDMLNDLLLWVTPENWRSYPRMEPLKRVQTPKQLLPLGSSVHPGGAEQLCLTTSCQSTCRCCWPAQLLNPSRRAAGSEGISFL